MGTCFICISIVMFSVYTWLNMRLFAFNVSTCSSAWPHTDAWLRLKWMALNQAIDNFAFYMKQQALFGRWPAQSTPWRSLWPPGMIDFCWLSIPIVDDHHCWWSPYSCWLYPTLAVCPKRQTVVTHTPTLPCKCRDAHKLRGRPDPKGQIFPAAPDVHGIAMGQY